MTPTDWADQGARSVAIHLDGADDPDRAADGTLLIDDDFLLLINAWWEPVAFRIPSGRAGRTWIAEIDTCEPDGIPAPGEPAAGEDVGGGVAVRPRSIVVLRRAA